MAGVHGYLLLGLRGPTQFRCIVVSGSCSVAVRTPCWERQRLAPGPNPHPLAQAAWKCHSFPASCHRIQRA